MSSYNDHNRFELAFFYNVFPVFRTRDSETIVVFLSDWTDMFSKSTGIETVSEELNGEVQKL